MGEERMRDDARQRRIHEIRDLLREIGQEPVPDRHAVVRAVEGAGIPDRRLAERVADAVIGLYARPRPRAESRA